MTHDRTTKVRPPDSTGASPAPVVRGRAPIRTTSAHIDMSHDDRRPAELYFPREIEAMQRDKERLDWLDKVNAELNERYGSKYGWRFDVNHNRASLSDHHHPPLSVREAIDRAMERREETA